jgi:hypothetical protein
MPKLLLAVLAAGALIVPVKAADMGPDYISPLPPRPSSGLGRVSMWVQMVVGSTPSVRATSPISGRIRAL